MTTIIHDRRRFLGTAAAAVISANFSLVDSAVAQTREATTSRIEAASRTSFGPLKQSAAGLLNVGYAEAGPSNGPRRDSPARLALRHFTVSWTWHLCWRQRATA
jgi:hypothetical protein